ncbi:MAG: hypothetical protein HY208_00990 [Nitrospirae bacterium]|nr:hypothetical protein [Nitrospirota bacterium]
MTSKDLDARKVVTMYSAHSNHDDLLFGKIFHRFRAAAIGLLESTPGCRAPEESYLAVRRHCRINPFRYRQLIQCVNQKPAHDPAY